MIGTGFAVAAGGAVGATLRWGVGEWATRLGAGVGVGTAAVNVLGSLLMGLAVALLADRVPAVVATGLTTGLLGGFTTFSTFSLDTVRLVERGEVGPAAVYVLGSIVLALGGLVAGLAIGRGLAA